MSNLRLPFPIIPASQGEASHYAKYGVGGLHCVLEIADLEKIPDGLKEIGMLVFVYGINEFYTWTGTDWSTLGHANWDLFETDIEGIKERLSWGEYE